MDDREIVRVTLKRSGISCPKCQQSSGLEALTDSIREASSDEHKRQLIFTVHCSSCGVLPTPLKITVAKTDAAYSAMKGFGEKMKNWRPSAGAVAQANKIKNKRVLIDPTKPWYPEAA